MSVVRLLAYGEVRPTGVNKRDQHAISTEAVNYRVQRDTSIPWIVCFEICVGGCFFTCACEGATMSNATRAAPAVTAF